MSGNGVNQDPATFASRFCVNLSVVVSYASELSSRPDQ